MSNAARWQSLVERFGLNADPSDPRAVRRELVKLLAQHHPDKTLGDFTSGEQKSRFHEIADALAQVDELESESFALVPLDARPSAMADVRVAVRESSQDPRKRSLLSSRYAIPKVGAIVLALLGVIFAHSPSLEKNPLTSRWYAQAVSEEEIAKALDAGYVAHCLEAITEIVNGKAKVTYEGMLYISLFTERCTCESPRPAKIFEGKPSEDQEYALAEIESDADALPMPPEMAIRFEQTPREMRAHLDEIAKAERKAKDYPFRHIWRSRLDRLSTQFANARKDAEAEVRRRAGTVALSVVAPLLLLGILFWLRERSDDRWYDALSAADSLQLRLLQEVGGGGAAFTSDDLARAVSHKRLRLPTALLVGGRLDLLRAQTLARTILERWIDRGVVKANGVDRYALLVSLEA
jgi:hypothetical protein